MEYRVLGPLEALGGEGPLPLGGAKQRALLALLILNANRVVSRERLIDELWGDDPPETAVTSVQVYVSRLRKLLPDGALVTRAPGYLLEVEPEGVDLIRFEGLVKQGRAALAAGDADLAASTIREAIALWRGPALTEFAAEPFAQIEGARLDDLRLAALEDRVDADLQLGRHAEVTGELEVLIASHPHRERLRAQLMLALYRSGRQSEALDVYRNLHAMLNEIGIEPGESLQVLERQILNHDQAIDAPTVPSPIADATAPRQLERKRVTVLFAVLAATSELDEDPEETGAFLDQLHTGAAAEIEAAGGTVEEGLVGALLATFAQPEDHATRAAKAALETQRRLSRVFGEALSLRIAIESGEVIIGPDSLVMGTPVAASARLVGVAQPGDVVVGHRAGPAIEAEFELREHGQAHVLVGAREKPLPREVRKMVTVLFAGLVESTQLGLQLDLEAFSTLMSDYFRAMESIVVRHGGIVEKFIGDAVMAIFGVPVLHEDDPLRAVRAACEMRESLASLNDEFERTWGVRLQGRIGVNSGEVMAGDLRGYLIVTGPTVTVAKRFEEAAAANEILISDATHRLVRDAVVAKRVSGRTVKGGETLEGFALAEVRPHAPGRARRFDTPLVDREQEYGALLNAFETVVESRECHLLTVLGEAGVGKSRLVQEFAGEVGAEATVLHGRCLPYGEGITYWPLSEIVRDILDSDGSADAEQSRAAIAALLPDNERADLIAELISQAIGLSGTTTAGTERTFWAVRRLFESLAQARPLVIVFDDLQWAEPTFIDLVDDLADHTRDAPVLLICVARPELFDSHPDWGGGKRHGATTSLKPLHEDDSRRLITNLLGGGSLPASVTKRIADLAEGNALFTEELLAMLVDEKRLVRAAGGWIAADDLSDLRVPQEINTFLAARLEGVPEGERTLLVRASVEGTLFHYGALRELSPELSESSLRRDLTSLVRRDLIRPDRATFSGDDAYRFRHILIRDAAYGSLSKAARAELQERFAAWLERAAGPRIREYEEIVGYHLEQAYLCRRDIGSPDEELKRLGASASERLESAGRRALARADLPAAIGLLGRASDPRMVDEARRARLLPELGAALIGTGSREGEAERILAEARRLATAVHDDCADAHALVQQQVLHVFRAADRAPEEATRAVSSVIPIFERYGDEHGLCRARRLQGLVQWNAARAAAAVESLEQAATHARLAGDEDERSEILSWIVTSMVFGPTPVPAAIRRCEEIRAEVADNPTAEAWALRSLAGLHAMDGDIDRARELLTQGNAIFEEFGLTRYSAATDIDGIVEMLAGDPAAAEGRLRSGYLVLEEMGDKAFRPTTAAHLAQALLAQGRADEAWQFTRISEDLGADDDLLTQVVWRGVRARILSEQGRMDEADDLANEAVAIGELTDFLNTQAGARIDLAHVRHRAGRLEQATAAAVEGLALYEQKGNKLAAGKIRAHLAVSLEV